MFDTHEKEIAKLQKLVKELHVKTALYELEKQNTRGLRTQIDTQVEMFGLMHGFTRRGFAAASHEELAAVLAEGVVDIFQLETALVLLLNPSGDMFCVCGSCNPVSDSTAFAVSREWLERPEFLTFNRQGVVVELPPGPDSPFVQLGLSYAVYMPFFSNERKMEGLVLGGITDDGAAVYDRLRNPALVSFPIYCQTMNGIYNNMSALALALAGTRAKSQFLSNLSHEIRTPMNAIMGMTQIAQGSTDPQEIKNCFNQIDMSSRHLLGLINDVLDMSKIEEGKLELERIPFALDAVLDNIISGFKSTASAKGVSLTLNMQGFRNLRLVGDPMRLAQVLINFVSNAVKFTSSGGSVTLAAELLACDADKACLGFAVSDTGIGMTEESLSRIFSPFEQADASTSRKYGGTGLGLSISRSLVELMGSEIHVVSTFNEGSCFSFQACFENSTAPEAHEERGGARQRDFSGKRFLIVDDVAINLSIVESLLEDTGAAMDRASNGREAVDAFMASPEGWYDLILMDVQMPVLDGCDATREIRALPRKDAASVRIIAMTANVFKEDQQMVAAAGMNGHIAKPVDFANAMEVIDQILRPNRKEGHA